MGTILLILLILLLVGALPTWPYSSGWGYYPTGGLGLTLRYYPSPCLNGKNLKLGGLVSIFIDGGKQPTLGRGEGRVALLTAWPPRACS